MDPVPLDPWLGHLEAHLPVARAGRDPEGVHQVRVALGRIDLWLRAAGLRVLRDDVRWLRSGAGRVRDLDVQLSLDPPNPWARRLERERVAAREELLRILDQPRVGGLVRALRLLPALPGERLESFVEDALRRVEKRGKRLEKHPEDVERYHDLRKAVRRLRYALEWADRSATPVKRMQDALGDLNDAAVTLRMLDELAAGDADELALLNGFRASREARVDELRAATLVAWRAYDPRGDR